MELNNLAEQRVPLTSRDKYVFNMDDVGSDIFGKHLKDFNATGRNFSYDWMKCFTPGGKCNWKWYLGYCPSCDILDYTVKFSFFTEGILERKRTELNECFGCCKYDTNSWRWYPRHEIDHVQVDSKSHNRCCGFCHVGPCALWCENNHTYVDIITRDEIVAGTSDATKKVSLKFSPEEAEAFFVYCQNYTYNTNFHAARVYNMEFLKNVCSDKYNIGPSDWVNYYLSTNGEINRPPIPHNPIAAKTSALPAAGGGQKGPCDQCCQQACCRGMCGM